MCPEKQPFFSIILATYNRAYCLSEAIFSVLGQSFSSWELIIVDDGSTDSTLNLTQPFTQKDPRILCIRQKNQGLAHTRNQGMKRARGKYITFLDSDDTFHPSHLEARFKVLTLNPGLEFLHGGVKITGNPYVPDKNNPKKNLHLLNDNLPIGGTFFIQKQSAMKLGGFPKVKYSEDSEYFRKVLRAKIKMKKVSQKTYLYNRTSTDSICARMARYHQYDRLCVGLNRSPF